MNKKGQGLLEYSVLLIVIIAALLATSTYVKRGVQGRWKSAVDNFGDQYDPRTANGVVMHAINSSSNTIVSINQVTDGAWTLRQDSTASTENTTGNLMVN